MKFFPKKKITERYEKKKTFILLSVIEKMINKISLTITSTRRNYTIFNITL